MIEGRFIQQLGCHCWYIRLMNNSEIVVCIGQPGGCATRQQEHINLEEKMQLDAMNSET